jgi:hypothetical protein
MLRLDAQVTSRYFGNGGQTDLGADDKMCHVGTYTKVTVYCLKPLSQD